jgi:hypothetical protein
LPASGWAAGWSTGRALTDDFGDTEWDLVFVAS